MGKTQPFQKFIGIGIADVERIVSDFVRVLFKQPAKFAYNRPFTFDISAFFVYDEIDRICFAVKKSAGMLT